MLIHIPNLLSSNEVQQARSLLDSAAWVDGRLSAGEQAAQVKNNEQLPQDSAEAQTARQLILQGIDRSTLFLTAGLPKKIFTPRFNRYRGNNGGGHHYGEHVDNAVRFTDTGMRVRTDLSCTVFLSKPSEYDGGELVVKDTLGSQQIKFAAGDAVLYPGTRVHEVLPITRGQRLACFFWVESMVRHEEQRRLLYALDMALMALRQEHGDSAATVALTGTYHNLLRMWTDT